jgi:hypothetical protein
MNQRVKDLTSKRFGRWTVESFAYVKEFASGVKSRRSFWNCKCKCGNKGVVRGESLKNGKSKSCGCLQKDTATKHGWMKHSLYNTWRNMISRCYNPKDEAYSNYGGRGIAVFSDWKTSLLSFADYVEKNLGKRPEGFSLDRTLNNGNYEPGNLRWASGSTQCRNKRIPKTLSSYSTEELLSEIERRNQIVKS